MELHTSRWLVALELCHAATLAKPILFILASSQDRVCTQQMLDEDMFNLAECHKGHK
uniref:Macaca fascicularis brain cDNA clone: QflA-19289, similar to human COP9 constitutive photomorphogenic homolog subunit 7B(Arabidopsis) (COPS7B), mRNA, RefSeq: NM_022730.1 n=1 Tax=Macaca fascicularis TaxID=9541 RepID=I7G650_MACFA|nr:unnamed protein product [Macaca fascicularis]